MQIFAVMLARLIEFCFSTHVVSQANYWLCTNPSKPSYQPWTHITSSKLL